MLLAPIPIRVDLGILASEANGDEEKGVDVGALIAGLPSFEPNTEKFCVIVGLLVACLSVDAKPKPGLVADLGGVAEKTLVRSALGTPSVVDDGAELEADDLSREGCENNVLPKAPTGLLSCANVTGAIEAVAFVVVREDDRGTSAFVAAAAALETSDESSCSACPNTVESEPNPLP